MMPTIERQIDALGGADSHPEFVAALDAAAPIAAEADALVEELMEWIEDILTGVPLATWATEAQIMLARLKHRRGL